MLFFAEEGPAGAASQCTAERGSGCGTPRPNHRGLEPKGILALGQTKQLHLVPRLNCHRLLCQNRGWVLWRLWSKGFEAPIHWST